MHIAIVILSVLGCAIFSFSLGLWIGRWTTQGDKQREEEAKAAEEAKARIRGYLQ